MGDGAIDRKRRWAPSLRTRVMLAAVAAVALVLVTVGVALVGLVERDQRRALDDRLERAAAALDRPRLLTPEGAEGVRDAAADAGAVVRVTGPDGETALEVGDDARGLPPPTQLGYTTVDTDDGELRVLTVETTRLGELGTNVQVAAPTAPLEDAVAALRRRFVGLGFVAIAATGLVGWALGGGALRPLSRLRRTAEDVATHADPKQRVGVGPGPSEVDDLARSFNRMLMRLDTAAVERERAADAAREFAANAAHELRTPMTAIRTNLDVLARSDLPDDVRADVLAEVDVAAGRVAAVLDALHQLARGEVDPADASAPIDLADVVDVAVADARRRHPGATITFEADTTDDLVVAGWSDGLRVLVENLLDNAARHGRPSDDIPATVEVGVATDGADIVLTVADDGPGIPVDERSAVLGRFTRGEHVRATGSGLGLALVDQQVRLHRASLTIDDRGPHGCRVRVRFPGRVTGTWSDAPGTT